MLIVNSIVNGWLLTVLLTQVVLIIQDIVIKERWTDDATVRVQL